MKHIVFFISIFWATILPAQSAPSTSINGNYTAVKAERGTTGPSKEKIIQYGENNGIKFLAIAACERCMPAVFTYNKEYSKVLGKPAFNNNIGYYIFTYDEDSFVLILISTMGDELIKFSNFYSKDALKARAMNASKVNDFAMEMLELL